MKLPKVYHSSKYYEFFPEKRRKSRDFVLFFRSGDSGSLLDTRKKIRTKNRKNDVVRKENKKQI